MYIYLEGGTEDWGAEDSWMQQATELLEQHSVYNPSSHLPFFLKGNVITTESVIESSTLGIVQDLHNLRKAEILLIKLDLDEVSIDTLIKLGIAYTLEITVVGWGKGPVINHPLIKEVAKARFDALEEATEFINNL